MENDILTRARTMVSRLSQHHAQVSSRAPQVENRNRNQQEQEQSCPEALMTASAAIVVELRLAIQETVVSEDSERMARLLNVNDELLELMRRMSRGASDASSGTDGVGGGESESESERQRQRQRQRVVLQGLGLSFDGGATTLESEVKKHERDVAREPDTDVVPDPVTEHFVSDGAEGQGRDEGSMAPISPRVDKGKGRAEPAEEKHEMMTSSSYAVNSDSEDDDERRMTNSEMSLFSPTER